jgi:cell wall-associated NlpC family hydrolase
MRKFVIATIMSVVVSGVSLAQTKLYEVKNGDTLGGVAQKFHVSTSDLIRANGISNSNKLKLGQKLSIPKAQVAAAKKPTALSPGSYKVRNGDHDWAIAARYGINPSDLRRMNPGVEWTRLQIGQLIKVPTRATTQPSPAAKSTSLLKLASSQKPTSKWGFPTTVYCVKKGDNDWTLAHRFGIGLNKFKALNPSINTGKLMPGQYVRVPGTKGAVLAVSNVIRSRYAVIVKDDVLVRRGASTKAEKITTVDQGTQVGVLDRQNGWYKLKFPRGTVGWVRGDMLKPLTKSYVAANNRTRSSTRVASNNSSNRNYRRSSEPATKFAFNDNGAGNGDIVNNAMGMLGTRYRLGSASRAATDCSGLVLQAANRAGIKLPRTSSQMSHSGSAVAKGNLKPGDLVFFRTRGSRISHVGIYKGNGQFVHSSSGKGHVTVSNLNEGYYSRRYAGARRVAGSSKSTKKTEPKPEEKNGEKKTETTTDTKPVEKPVTRNTDEINP